ncbi:nucleoside hydrolase [Nocardia seriolae]|uniref:nucleoside hydrolase n=1 Tax=Nocardia seriolae TaxID=37332 RepID=UPI001E41BFD2|nr:nucleoside hydrolase [Nocardia seriolae]
MTDDTSPREPSPNEIRDALIDPARSVGLHERADALSALPDMLPPLSTMPLIVDTDIGGDPDDAIAVAVAAGRPELALVITSDEHGGRRAGCARHLLDLLGRSDVPVVAGIDLGNEKYWAAEGLVPRDAPEQSWDVLTAVRKVLAATDGKVRWLGIGPMSNLSTVVDEIPDAAARLIVTQMGGGLNYRHTDRAEHNIRLDVAAARKVLHAGLRTWIVPSDVTFHPANEITSSSAEYELLAKSGPAGKLLRSHMDQWFANFYPGTMQHDAMALAQAIGRSFLRTSRIGVGLDAIGRMIPGEYQVTLTRSADYAVFRSWLTQRLDQVLAP